MRRNWLDDIAQLNELKLSSMVIQKLCHASRSMKWRTRCKASVPELTDLSNETEDTLALYGPQVKERNICVQLLDGASTCGTRCTLCAIDACRLGSTWKRDDRALYAMQRHRPTVGWLVQDNP